MRPSLLAGVGAAFVLAMAAACGGSNPTVPPVPSVAVPSITVPSVAIPSVPAGVAVTCLPQSGSGQAVGIVDFSFSPGTLSVSTGTTVTWTNNGSATHTVTFDNGPDCGQVTSGSSTNAVFAAPGSYAYHCTIHPQMKGTITVS